MTPAVSPHYPLLDLFRDWQEHDRKRGHQSLDTDTYLVLLDALERGVGVWNRDDLKALCMALLVKPHHNEEKEHQFDQFFDKYLENIVRQTDQIEVDKVDEEGLKNNGKSGTNKPIITPPSYRPPVSLPPEITVESDKTQQKKGTKISHVAFRHDADLVEGVSSGADSPDAPGWADEANRAVFRLEGKYLPVEGRAVQQVMRSLRQLIPKRQQLLTDLPATIRRVARRGYFDRVVSRRELSAHISLVLLLDRRGSMVAFHDTVDQWADAASRQQPAIPVYYFQNCPVNCVFSDPWLTKPVSLSDWKQRHPDAYVLIVSDAGAARGLYSDERLMRTRQFLKDLRPRRVAWLNPMPRHRWWRSTAVFIASQVPMFALDSLEFANAFKFLKGKLSVA